MTLGAPLFFFALVLTFRLLGTFGAPDLVCFGRSALVYGFDFTKWLGLLVGLWLGLFFRSESIKFFTCVKKKKRKKKEKEKKKNNNFQHYNILSAYEVKGEASTSISLVFYHIGRSKKILVKK
jgi:hypothetical protein